DDAEEALRDEPEGPRAEPQGDAVDRRQHEHKGEHLAREEPAQPIARDRYQLEQPEEGNHVRAHGRHIGRAAEPEENHGRTAYANGTAHRTRAGADAEVEQGPALAVVAPAARHHRDESDDDERYR